MRTIGTVHDVSWARGFRLHPTPCNTDNAPYLLPQVTMGVLRIDYEYQTNLGDILDPRSFDFRIISATAEGLTFAKAKAGDKLDATGKELLERAVRQLIDNGADFIVGDCGFLVYWQVMVRDYAQDYAQKKYGRKCPVMMSSLVLALPLLATIPSGGQIGILTASEKSLQAVQKKLPIVIEDQQKEDGGQRSRSVPAAEDPSGIMINFSDPRFKVPCPFPRQRASPEAGTFTPLSHRTGRRPR